MLGEQCLQVVLSTDFTDFCYALVWYVCLSRLQVNQANQ